MQEADKIRAAMDKRSEENVSKSMRDIQDGPASSWYGKANEAVKDFANWGNEIGEAVKEGPAGQAFDTTRTVMADVNRRVFEEPWFGKPVADILFERQQGTVHGPSRDKPEEQDAAKVEPAQQGTVHGQEQQEQATIHGKNEPQQEKDNFWENFFGQQQAAEQERGNQMGQEQGR